MRGRVWLLALGVWCVLPLRGEAGDVPLDTHRPFVSQEIHYRASDARAVSLLWGVNGWRLVPVPHQPAGTTQSNVMRTPMALRDGVFTTTIRMPAGTLLDYGFLVSSASEGGESPGTWDGDYVATLHGGGVRDRHTPRRNAWVRGGWLALGLSGVGFVLGILVGSTRRSSASVGRAATRTVALRLPVAPRGAACVLGASAALAGVLVAATSPALQSWTARVGSGERAARGARFLLQELNLLDENVIASWYSSMLLLLIAITAGLGAVRDVQRHPTRSGRIISCGWLVTAAIFVVLSFDEMGAIHERVGKISDFAVMLLQPFQGAGVAPDDTVDLLSIRPALRYVSLALPIAAVGLFLVTFGWIRLRRTPGALILLAVGTAFFLCVPFYEHFEQHALRPSAGFPVDWQTLDRAIWLEEATELLGMLAFLGATTTYLVATVGNQTGATPRPGVAWRVSLRSASRAQAAGLAALGLAMVGMEAMRRYLPIDDDGIPENWFASALAALSAFGCVLLWMQTPRGRRRRTPYLTCGVFNLLLSMYFGANAHGYLHQPSAGQLGWWVHAGLCLAAGLLSIQLALRVSETWSRLGGVAWALLLGAAFTLGDGYAPVLAFLAYGVLLMSLLPHVTEHATGD